MTHEKLLAHLHELFGMVAANGSSCGLACAEAARALDEFDPVVRRTFDCGSAETTLWRRSDEWWPPTAPAGAYIEQIARGDINPAGDDAAVVTELAAHSNCQFPCRECDGDLVFDALTANSHRKIFCGGDAIRRRLKGSHDEWTSFPSGTLFEPDKYEYAADFCAQDDISAPQPHDCEAIRNGDVVVLDRLENGEAGMTLRKTFKGDTNK